MCLGAGFALPCFSQQHTDAVSDQKIEELLQLKAEMVKKNQLDGRYVIQLGSFSSMDRANETMKAFQATYPDLPVRLEYESPNYKIWAGLFTSRLSAERLFVTLKEKYKSAFVFRPK